MFRIALLHSANFLSIDSIRNLTCAFCKGETRQQTTELQFKLKLSSINRKLGSNAYIRHFPSITRANFGPDTERIYCCASSRQFLRSLFYFFLQNVCNLHWVTLTTGIQLKNYHVNNIYRLMLEKILTFSTSKITAS